MEEQLRSWAARAFIIIAEIPKNCLIPIPMNHDEEKRNYNCCCTILIDLTLKNISCLFATVSVSVVLVHCLWTSCAFMTRISYTTSYFVPHSYFRFQSGWILYSSSTYYSTCSCYLIIFVMWSGISSSYSIRVKLSGRNSSITHQHIYYCVR